MTVRYCVYLTTYSGQLLPPFYIGSSYISKVQKGYRGSVSSMKWKSIWLKELKENPELFQTQIVSIHKTRKEALDFELKYQKEENVVCSELFMNESFARGTFDSVGRTYEEIYGEEAAKILKEKRRKAWLGKPKPHLKGKLRPEAVKAKMRKKKSEQARKNIAEAIQRLKSKAVLCVETGKIYVSASQAQRETGCLADQAARTKGKSFGYHWKYVEN